VSNEGDSVRVTPRGSTRGWDTYYAAIESLPKPGCGIPRGLYVSRAAKSEAELTGGVEKIIEAAISEAAGQETLGHVPLYVIGKRLVDAGYTAVMVIR